MTTSNFENIRFPNLVALVARTWRKTIDKRLQIYNLTEATWLPLVYLSRLDKPIRQKELASMLSLDSSSVVRILNHLESLGFIERIPEEKDLRAKATAITPKGREIIEHIETISKSLESEIKNALDPNDFKKARQTLENLYQILNNMNQTKDEDLK